jgi:ABC-type lipoprotein export system ATPase subunit
MISTTNLFYQYANNNTIRFPDFTIGQGQQCLLLGESGSGKTTLLHLMGGLLRGYNGSLRVGETELSGLSETGLDRFRGQRIGFIFQKNHLITALTVEQNLQMAPYLAGLKPDATKISATLERLGLKEKSKSKVTDLSQGQAQRVAIARAVLNNPAILLADEPTSALDDKNCEKVIDLLLDVAREHQSTLVVATHDQRLKDKLTIKVSLGINEIHG